VIKERTLTKRKPTRDYYSYSRHTINWALTREILRYYRHGDMNIWTLTRELLSYELWRVNFLSYCGLVNMIILALTREILGYKLRHVKLLSYCGHVDMIIGVLTRELLSYELRHLYFLSYYGHVDMIFDLWHVISLATYRTDVWNI